MYGSLVYPGLTVIHLRSQGKNAKFKKYVGHSAHVTNVRWTHDDSRLVSVGGADTSVMVWSHGRANEREEVAGDSDDSDTDSEEEGGYDSDVEREKNMNYEDKTYVNPLRTTKGVKPHMREKQDDGEHRFAVQYLFSTEECTASLSSCGGCVAEVSVVLELCCCDCCCSCCCLYCCLYCCYTL